MREIFHDRFDWLAARLQGDEVLTAWFEGEESDFVRFNQSRIRQPGSVRQMTIVVDLIAGKRLASGTITLAGDRDVDHTRLEGLLGRLREQLTYLPDDPYLLFNREPVRNGDRVGEDRLPDSGDALDAVLAAGEGRDLVGIWASGPVHRGFASSLGQRNWYTNYSYSLDWCFYHQGDKAVKCTFAGFAWDQQAFNRRVADAVAQLAVLQRPAMSLEPGRYRVFLAPKAVADMTGLMIGSGVGIRGQRTRRSGLLRMLTGDARLSEQISASEHTAAGIAPPFQANGFIRPDRVSLIERGRLADPLVSPRSAREYDVPTNGANEREVPDSFELEPGELSSDNIPAQIGDGVLVNNVWYLNFSDRPGNRVTGMTRFATFCVENGEIVAPLNVMRWDETGFRAFGENLVGLTSEREMIFSTNTYGGRATHTVHAPGALVDDFAFTL